jgi:hypothetical protein
LQAQSPAAEQAPPQQQEEAAQLRAQPHSQEAYQVIQQQGQNLGVTTSI